ncbi:hypothetical protein BDD12DRAFT_876869 [Trichophaea hybrida]|nr:hypothetical protein BDD12DRAFT_876869 [Trichophaea hybrida]
MRFALLSVLALLPVAIYAQCDMRIKFCQTPDENGECTEVVNINSGECKRIEQTDPERLQWIFRNGGNPVAPCSTFSEDFCQGRPRPLHDASQEPQPPVMPPMFPKARSFKCEC